MTIRKIQPDRIAANRLDMGYGYIFLAGLQNFLAGLMAANFSRR